MARYPSRMDGDSWDRPDDDPVVGLPERVRRRLAVLSVAADGPVDRGRLLDAFDTSPSTVDRTVRSLRHSGLIETRPEGYQTTLPGRLTLELAESFADGLTAVERASTVLSALPPDTRLDPDVVRGAEVVVPSRTDPGGPLDRIGTLLASATRVRAIVGTFSPRYVELAQERMAADAPLHLVVDPSSAERLVSEYGDVVSAVSRTGALELRELDHGRPYGLGLYESEEGWTLTLAVYGPSGLRGLLVSDRPAAVRWGQRAFDDAWDRGEHLL